MDETQVGRRLAGKKWWLEGEERLWVKGWGCQCDHMYKYDSVKDHIQMFKNTKTTNTLHTPHTQCTHVCIIDTS